ncbi:MAG: glycosyltransferase family 39 protein [Caldilineaceae bacterium]
MSEVGMGQGAKGREQGVEDRGQRTEGRRQRAEVTRPSPPAPRHSLLLLFILLLALVLRFYQLTASSLWNDEGNSWALVGRTFGQIARDAAADIHPPGYYWLLKIWTMLFGASAGGMRSLSAVLGIGLVFIVYKIGRYCAVDEASRQRTALLAALLAALNPFQVYYSQEARMYMLLTLESAGLFWGLLALLKRRTRVNADERGSKTDKIGVHPRLSASVLHKYAPAFVYVLCGIAGLWTHYSFPIVLAAAGLTYLWNWLTPEVRHSEPDPSPLASRPLLPAPCPLPHFFLLNILILLAFAPWLPTAIDRVLHWPKGGETVAILDGLRRTLQMFLFGPLRQLPAPLWPWLGLAALLPLLGLLALPRPANRIVTLWLLAPVLLMFGLGLFSDAFLKFLLVASPAWCLAGAAAPEFIQKFYPTRTLFYALQLPLLLLVLLGAALSAAFTLPSYYSDPVARDNYASVARYIQVMGNPTADLVLLDAPGQQEVWRYYDPGLPRLTLPQQRPPDPQQTLTTLADAVKDRQNVYALFWATDEADPQQLVEHWLDQNAFKGLDSWQGNLRFVTYRMPNHLTCGPLTPQAIFGQQIRLTEQCQPSFPQRLAAGEVGLIGLRWQALTKLTQRYKVSVQVLDKRNQVIAQQDSEPAGGSQPTDQWQPKATIVDNHGLNIPFGTPPGVYRLIAALYDDANGQRLPNGNTDHIDLGQLEVQQTARAIPVDILRIQHRVTVALGPVRLVGYAAYRKDYAHAPDTPIQPGNLVHFTFYWQAPNPLPANWPADLKFKLELGNQQLNEALVPGYPTAQWQPSGLVRGEFDLPFDGTNPIPVLWIGEVHLRLTALPR